jgi:phosphoribosyl 1,2-cyclic phosphodiesterase/DNA-binding NarL/FixJ family response regulator
MSPAKQVLIIDDDADYRRVVGELLQAHGWSVLEAGEGEQGLAIARQHRPEFVLCDLLMPRGNGFLVCRALRNDPTLRHTKIVVTSGRDYEADRLAAREAGAHEYLTKPIAGGQLAALLSSWSSGASKKESAANEDNGKQPARIKFWGVRGSIATPGPSTVRYGGNTSCVEVRSGGEIIILDAGTGLRNLGRALMAEFKDRPLNVTLLLSHTHWDHIQGLPFFQPIYDPRCRLRILGFEGARKGLVHVLTGQMESPYFPVPFSELPGNIEIEELKDLDFQVGNVRVRAAFANHPGICVGYRLFTADGSVAFFPDNEPYGRHQGTTLIAPTKGSASLEYARTEEHKMAEFLRDVDALILDSQYDATEYNSHVGWGHGCVEDCVAVALQARAKKLFLFHHDPDHDDAKLDAMAAHAREIVTSQKASLQVEIAREGAAIELAEIARSK